MRRLINLRPGRGGAAILAALPFLILVAVYLFASGARLAENPNDKLLPPLSAMLETFIRMASEPDRRSGELLLWADTAASLARLGTGLAIAGLGGLAVGVVVGLLPYARSTASALIAVISMIPPLAVLPILFIAFGLGELSKVVLIVIGVGPFLIRDTAMAVQALPDEQIVKAQTLGATTWQVALRIVLPQVLPRVIDAVRLALGAAWLFLISAEAIAATDGLGYRIFLVRRYLAMDVILPYVAWITLLAYALDAGLAWINRRFFGWAQSERR